MPTQICHRCGKLIQDGSLLYRLIIKVLADYDGLVHIKDGDVDIKAEFDKVKGLPADLLEEEVFKEFYFTLCPRCKEIYCANPLFLPLDRRTTDSPS